MISSWEYYIIEVIKSIEDKTNKEIQYISFYKTGEVKELTFVVNDLFGEPPKSGVEVCD